MKLHHIAYACDNIPKYIAYLKTLYNIKHTSPIVFDTEQDCEVCLLEMIDSPNIELICGKPVKRFIDEGRNLYHSCYEVDDLRAAIEQFMVQGGTIVSQPKPAILFDNRYVVFIQTKLGLIELLEKTPTYQPDAAQYQRSIVISGNFTTDFIFENVCRLCRELGLIIDIKQGPYNQVIQSLIDDQSLMNNSTQVINLIFISPTDWVKKSSNLDVAGDLFKDSIDTLTSVLTKRGNNSCLYHLIIGPFQQWINEDPTLVKSCFDELNRLRKKLSIYNNITIILPDELQFINEITDYHDSHANEIAHVSFNIIMTTVLSWAGVRKICTSFEKPYKVVVVDCDNTLWSGVCGETGAECLVDYGYQLFQRKLIELSEKGMLVCLCSKNNQEDVFHVFKNVNKMLLSFEHITAYRINWDSKVNNIVQLSNYLNINLDDFIFIDDSKIECEAVRAGLPQVLVLDFPEKSEDIKNWLDNIWVFDIAKGSDFDKNRKKFYKDNELRKIIEVNSKDLQNYIDNLNVIISFKQLEKEDLGRVVQLNYRVNQFTMNSIRYSIEDYNLRLSENHQFVVVHVSDKFGEYGIVGLLGYTIDKKNHMNVYNFFLSCRALGRGVEHKMLSYLVQKSKELNCKKLILHFEKTSKNIPAQEFLSKFKFLDLNADVNMTKCRINIPMNKEYGIQYQLCGSINFIKPATYSFDKSREEKKRIQQLLVTQMKDLDAITQLISHSVDPNSDQSLISNQDIVENILRKALNSDTFSLKSNFVFAGGDSLSAVRVISQVNESLGIQLTLEDLLNNKPISHLINKVAALSNIQKPNVAIVSSGQSLKQASYSQRIFWFHDWIDEGMSWYYNLLLFAHIKGPLNQALLEESIRLTVLQHESLRTTFFEEGDELFQRIHDDFILPFEIRLAKAYDYSEMREITNKLFRQPFRLSGNDLLLKVTLFEHSATEHTLVVINHHIIFDGFSYRIFLETISDNYNQLINNKKVVINHSIAQYYQFSDYHNYLVGSGKLDEKFEAFEERLTNIPKVYFPSDFPRTKKQTHNGHYLPIFLDANKTREIRNFAVKSSSSIYQTLLVIFGIIIGRHLGIGDVIITSPTSGRTSKQFDRTVGCFPNLIIQRLSIDYNTSFNDIMEENRGDIISTLNNQDLPFIEILERCNLFDVAANSSVFQIMLSMQPNDYECLTLENTQSEVYINGYDAARLEIILEIEEKSDTLSGGLYYNIDLFKQERMSALLAELIGFIEMVIVQPTTPIVNLFRNYLKTSSPILSALPFDIPKHKTICEYFVESVKRFPKKSAIVDKTEVITYENLDKLSNQLANFLVSQGANQSTRLGLIIPPSYWQVVCIVGCYKAGVSYVPIDHHHPDDYKKNILIQVMPKWVICTSQFEFDTQWINIEHLSAIMKGYSDDFRKILSNSEDEAYIIFTSGTTGTPKGAQLTQKNIVDLVSCTEKLIPLNEEDNIPLFHSIAFDLSVWEIWTALSYGGTLTVVPENIARSTGDFVELIINNNVTVLNQTPTAFRQLISYCINNKIAYLPIKCVLLGGEKANPRDYLEWSQIFSNVKIYNLYGITETTVHATFSELTFDMMSANKSDIGLPLPGKQIFILDDSMSPMPEGLPGEIYVGGHGLAAGYLGRDDLTKKVFVSHVISGQNLRLYKSGDLARYYEGRIEYYQRNDNQKHLRGFRIELDGIKSVLKSHPGILDCEISTISLHDDSPHIVAYIIPNQAAARPVYGTLDAENETIVLPNGMTIFHCNQTETDYLYKEIMAESGYEDNIISLPIDPIIIDVGANIGLFSMDHALRRPQAKIYAFEPIPSIYEILQKNIDLYNLNVECFKLGLSSEPGEAQFHYYPKASLFSGIERNLSDLVYDAEVYMHNLLSLNADLDAFNQDEVKELIESNLGYTAVACQLSTLSSFIDAHHINRIDLLKIDTETMEWAVLQGIRAEHWAIITNFIVEVHDENDNLIRFQQLFRDKGFTINLIQTTRLTGSKLYTLFATKHPMKQECPRPVLNKKYQFSNANELLTSVKGYCRDKLPGYMNPAYYRIVNSIPMTINGKMNFSLFKESLISEKSEHLMSDDTSFLRQILDVWRTVTNNENISEDDNFFNVGGDSILIMHTYTLLKKRIPMEFRIIDLFNHPSAKQFSDFLSSQAIKISNKKTEKTSIKSSRQECTDIAIIGYSGQFPQADNVDKYWMHLASGKDCITTLTKSEAIELGVPEIYASNSMYVPSCGYIEKIDLFDAPFFNLSATDATYMDPQFRVALEHCYQGLHNAGYDSKNYNGHIGVSFGMGHSYYCNQFIGGHHMHSGKATDILFYTMNFSDYLANRIAYHLNLSGSAININTACSTSLTAVIKGCESLISGENDMVLAGGVSLILPNMFGYLCTDQSILSKDGRCRPFDADASGTVPGSGVGVVVLKRLSDAIADQDDIKAVIKGYAINNDGNQKLNFAAPSLQGQLSCVRTAMANAKIEPDQISYVETHGTGTRLGDPIEIEALSQAFEGRSDKVDKCQLGSVKSNIGHTDSASGIAGLIKVLLMIKHKQIPPTVHFQNANEHAHLEKTHFQVCSTLKNWKSKNNQYIAGISSFGIGGTNCHLIVSNFMQNTNRLIRKSPQILAVSAPTQLQLSTIIKQLINFLESHQEHDHLLEDTSFTLIYGRPVFECRLAWIVTSTQDAIAQLIKYPRGNVNIDAIGDGQQQKLFSLARSWINREINLTDHIKMPDARRISLPAFPFSKKSYWYKRNYEKLDIEIFLMQMLKDIFKTDNIDPDSNIFALGIDSLDLLRLVNNLESKYDIAIDIDHLYRIQIVRKITEYVRTLLAPQNHIQHGMLKKLKAGNESLPLVIIHPIGGALHHFEDFLNQYTGDSVIYGIQNIPTHDLDPDSIEALSMSYVQLLKECISAEEYILLGWSMGGTIAWEMAYQLNKQRVKVKHLVMIDSWAKYPENFSDTQVAQIFFLENQPKEIESWMREWSDTLANRLRMLVKYQPSHLDISIALFKASHLANEMIDMNDKSNFWSSYSAKKLHTKLIESDHYSIVRYPSVNYIAEYCAKLSVKTRKQLDLTLKE